MISPINPHTLTVRPVVDSAERQYEIVVRPPNPSTYALVDGQAVHPLEPGDRVRVTKAAPEFQLVQIKGQGYYRTLREKLGWSGGAASEIELRGSVALLASCLFSPPPRFTPSPTLLPPPQPSPPRGGSRTIDGEWHGVVRLRL